MATSLIYKNARIYELLMRALYGRYYPDRYRALAALIPAQATVVDVCCGPATLYRNELRAKNVHYRGLDINPGFVQQVDQLGGDGELWDVHSDKPLPAADYVVMQASLYHFLPDPAPVLTSMLAAARQRVLIAEPIRNLATSDNKLLALVGRRFTNPGSGKQPHRFTEESLEAFFAAFQQWVISAMPVAGGREKLYVLDATSVPSC